MAGRDPRCSRQWENLIDRRCGTAVRADSGAPLVKHSLDYLIGDRLKAPDPATALLDLRIADIACGSGHIPLAAARRIATELAVVRTGEEQPSPPAFRAALREVIRTCIYGVDLNPLAVELCKVALWVGGAQPRPAHPSR
jgi:methylase of polypeptide subunit release factors